MCTYYDSVHVYVYIVHVCKCRYYHRSDFNYEILLFANCGFFHNSQSKDSQVKEYAKNISRTMPLLLKCAFKRVLDHMHVRTYTGSLAVEIEMSLHY